jgi:hypothetical protein
MFSWSAAMATVTGYLRSIFALVPISETPNESLMPFVFRFKRRVFNAQIMPAENLKVRVLALSR